jgi:D-glycero-alpha-D-manno-heptose-7-phosphate kinase
MPNLAIVRTPLRVSFVGGGSDLPPGPGAVVSCTIDKHVYAVAKRRNDSKIYLTWREKEIVDHVNDLKHDLVREALRETGFESGVEILTFADIPASGSGLGSSAATLVAVLHALFILRGYPDAEIDREWLASLACQIQIGRLKHRQGLQDEYACSLGGLRQLEFNPGPSGWLRVTNHPIGLAPIAIRDLCDSFLLFSVPNDAGRRAEDVLKSFQDSKEFRDGCIDLADEFKWTLESGRWDRLGPLLWKHHSLKTMAFSEYWPANFQYLSDAGLNFKLCGAGGSGHILVHCSRRTSSEVRSTVTPVWGPELPFSFVSYGTQLIHQE